MNYKLEFINKTHVLHLEQKLTAGLLKNIKGWEKLVNKYRKALTRISKGMHTYANSNGSQHSKYCPACVAKKVLE